MTEIVNLYDAKTHLSQLVERVAKGEAIIIARRASQKRNWCRFARRRPGASPPTCSGSHLLPKILTSHCQRKFNRRSRQASEDPSRHSHFLRWNSDPAMIFGPLREAIAEPGNQIHVSAASVWEIGIKRAIGKLAFAQRIVQSILAHRFEPLPISGDHAEYAAELPPYHTDPFDRMLVAQAHLERMLFGTLGAKIRPYGVAILGLAPS